MNHTTINEIIQELDSLVLFQLSLSSRELFHSNFLSWLLSAYPKKAVTVFSEYVAISDSEDWHIETVTREEKHIDLTVVFKNKQGDRKTLYIENKVKSIPYLEQLETYHDKLKTGSFLLLSLSEPNDEIQKNEHWQMMNYLELSEKIKEIQVIDGYHQGIIKEYARFIYLLHELYTHVMSEKMIHYDLYSRKSFMTPLKQIRLDDLFVKLKHQDMVNQLKEKLTCYDSLKKEKVVIRQEYTRGTGITDVRYWLPSAEDKQVGIGIQLQALSFKLMLETTDNSAHQIGQALLDNQWWFQFESLKEKNITKSQVVYPTSANKTFNKYQKNFVYQSMTLKENVSMDELLDAIVAYLLELQNHEEQILSVINQEGEM